jgi:hypothetical protein
MSPPHDPFPEARSEGLVTEDVGEELVVFDTERNVAHCLAPIAASVCRGCDGKHDQAALATLSAVSNDVLADALAALEAQGLTLTGPPMPFGEDVLGVSRRSAIKRIGMAGLATSSVPLRGMC